MAVLDVDSTSRLNLHRTEVGVLLMRDVMFILISNWGPALASLGPSWPSYEVVWASYRFGKEFAIAFS